MRKLKSLISANLSEQSSDAQFAGLAMQANAHLNLREFWQAIAPKLLSDNSFVGSLNDGQLTIYAYNASVATKIKLSSANLLSQLQNLQKTDPFYRECKVTAIVVKVQVKSQPKTSAKKARVLTKPAADHLKNFALQLGDSTLAEKLTTLANKH